MYYWWIQPLHFFPDDVTISCEIWRHEKKKRNIFENSQGKYFSKPIDKISLFCTMITYMYDLTYVWLIFNQNRIGMSLYIQRSWVNLYWFSISFNWSVQVNRLTALGVKFIYISINFVYFKKFCARLRISIVHICFLEWSKSYIYI